MNDALNRISANGFMQIPIAHSTQQLIDTTIKAAFAFFRLPEKDKATNVLPNDCGYRPMGVEYSQSSVRPDAIESFTASMRSRVAGSDLSSPFASHLHALMINTIELLEPIAEALVCEVAASLTHDYRHSKTICGALHRWSCLQLNYSRPAESSCEFINDAHEDGHLLTILQTTEAGLEVMKADSSYMPTSTRSGELLVMPGKTMWLLSGGVVAPLYHRVRRHEDVPERLSMLFFVDMDPKACQPWIQNNISISEDIAEHVLTNGKRFGLSGFGSE